MTRSKAFDQLEAVISAALDGIILLDDSHQVVSFNPAAQRIFGIVPESAMGFPFERFIPERLRRERAGPSVELGLAGETPSRPGRWFEMVGLRADGEEFPMEASISRIQISGEASFLIVLRDITERKRAEEELQESRRQEQARRKELEAFMEAVPAIVWIAHDPECRVITGNQAGQALLRLPAGTNLSKTAPENERPQHFQVFNKERLVPGEQLSMQRAGRTGEPVLGQELELRFSDGTRRWIYGNAVPLFKDDGSVRGVVATYIDITQRKEAEQALRDSEARERLRRAEVEALAARLQAVREEERARVAREIHDVLAQELTRLKLDIAWLSRRLNKPVDAEAQTALHKKLNEMTELADTAIRSVQKIATELRPVVLDSLGLCAAIEWQTRDFEVRTGIRCEAKLPEDDIVMDRERSTALFRILQESLTNVARHAQASKVDVRLFLDAPEIVLTIRDNGRGIREYEVDDPHSVGLLGMRERATLLGGHCSITGHPGAGTTVEARLPLPPTESHNEEPA